MGKRFIGELKVVLSDGYVERCIIKERGEKRFIERIVENVKIILESDPKTNGGVKVNYRGDFAEAIYDYLQKKKSEG